MNKIEPNFFYINRSLLHSSRWLSEPFTRGQAWVDLFGLAQHTDGFFRVRGIKVDVKRGQLAYSQVTLSKRWRWSRNKVRRYLFELEKQGDIEQQNNEVTTLIIILKYNQWQGSDTTNDTTEGQQKDSKRNTYNNDNNIKNEKKELSNDSVPFKTLKEYRNLRRVQAGNPLMKNKVATEKQKAFLKRMKSLDYFHKVGVEKEFDYLKEEDESANRKFQGIARTFEKRYGDNYKEVIDWWFNSDNAWCDYHPSNFYSVGTWMKFDNKTKNSKKGGGYYEI